MQIFSNGGIPFTRIAIRIGIPILIFLTVIAGSYLVAIEEYLIAAVLVMVPVGYLHWNWVCDGIRLSRLLFFFLHYS